MDELTQTLEGARQQAREADALHAERTQQAQHANRTADQGQQAQPEMVSSAAQTDPLPSRDPIPCLKCQAPAQKAAPLPCSLPAPAHVQQKPLQDADGSLPGTQGMSSEAGVQDLLRRGLSSGQGAEPEMGVSGVPTAMGGGKSADGWRSVQAAASAMRDTEGEVLPRITGFAPESASSAPDMPGGGAAGLTATPGGSSGIENDAAALGPGMQTPNTTPVASPRTHPVGAAVVSRPTTVSSEFDPLVPSQSVLNTARSHRSALSSVPRSPVSAQGYTPAEAARQSSGSFRATSPASGPSRAGSSDRSWDTPVTGSLSEAGLLRISGEGDFRHPYYSSCMKHPYICAHCNITK